MITKTLTITNGAGLHARPAQLFVQTANRFQARITVRKADGRAVDGKSILGLMSLAVGPGEAITVEADGPDAAAAVDALADLVAKKFGEDK